MTSFEKVNMEVSLAREYVESAQQAKGPAPSKDAPMDSSGSTSWPFDPNGNQNYLKFTINWNDNPSATDIENAYRHLLEYIKANPGDYNAYIQLLQMTSDIGSHLSSFSTTDQASLVQFLSTQLTSKNGDQTLLQKILEVAAKGAAVSQSSESAGEQAAEAFLTNLQNTLQPIINELDQEKIPTGIFGSLSIQTSLLQLNIGSWCSSHFKTFSTDGGTSSTWVDKYGLPLNMSSFAHSHAFSLGIFMLQDCDVEGTINQLYGQMIQKLVKELGSDPMLLIMALLSLINQQDEDRGTEINGYSNNLTTLSQGNKFIQSMLNDLSTSSPDAGDFYSNLQQLRSLIDTDPSLQSLAPQLDSDIDTINNQNYTPPSGTNLSWTVSAGYYYFPPGTTIQFNGQTFSVSGETYLSGGQVTIPSGSVPSGGYSFGQLAEMGNTSTIATVMGNWSSTVMSNFENGVTGIQALVNNASPAIQQEIQNSTQTMQAEENFEKKGYDMMSSLIQTIVKMMGQAG